MGTSGVLKDVQIQAPSLQLHHHFQRARRSYPPIEGLRSYLHQYGAAVTVENHGSQDSVVGIGCHTGR